MAEPVSIRTKNPGAMWPGSIATQFGSTSHENLRDGNKAAIFPTFEQGGAAQFALWAKNYDNLTLKAAIYKWSGHNSSTFYADFLTRHVPGLSMDTAITRAFLSSAQGLAFMKAQAQWEAGKPYPMTDAQWEKAQQIAFGIPEKAAAKPAPKSKPKKPDAVHVGTTATATAGSAVAAAQAGLPWWQIALIAVAAGAVAFLAIQLVKKG